MKPERTCSVFTKCCCCIPLRTGCFILGYLSLLMNLLIALFFAASLVIMAILTRGFRHNLKSDDVDDDDVDKARLQMTIMVVILIGCLNVAWVILNAFVLIGLHKKRPGPIRMHVALATIRLLLSSLGLLAVNTTRITACCWVEIGLSTYFIMLYYSYASQIHRELKFEESNPTHEAISDLVFKYPKNIDKQKLTDKDNIKIINV